MATKKKSIFQQTDSERRKRRMFVNLTRTVTYRRPPVVGQKPKLVSVGGLRPAAARSWAD